MFDAVAIDAAKVMHLTIFGLEGDDNADLAILQTRDKIEALRLRPARLAVIRRDKVISRIESIPAKLNLNGDLNDVDFQRNL